MSYFLAFFFRVFSNVFGDVFKIEMADVKEWQACVKFCFLLGKTATITVTMLRGDFKDAARGKT